MKMWFQSMILMFGVWSIQWMCLMYAFNNWWGKLCTSMGGKHPSQANHPFSAITLKGKTFVQKCDENIDNDAHMCTAHCAVIIMIMMTMMMLLMLITIPIITIATMNRVSIRLPCYRCFLYVVNYLVLYQVPGTMVSTTYQVSWQVLPGKYHDRNKGKRCTCFPYLHLWEMTTITRKHISWQE